MKFFVSILSISLCESWYFINFANYVLGNMYSKVQNYIKENNLFSKNDRVIVALSGGADSVALLHILVKLEYNIEAVHCNFHLRGEESMRDEMFVRELCKRFYIKLNVADFNTIEYATERKISIEMAARELRYDFFERVRNDQGASVIAVAHHQDDVAETILLNLIRGTGIRGLHGIQVKNGYIVRPLLCVGRNEILLYLQSIGEKYVVDSTNLKNDYTRNKIRLEILPLMREINPSITHTFISNAEKIAEAEKVYLNGIEEGKRRVFNNGNIKIPELLDEMSPSALLYEILSPLGFNSAQCKDILNNINGESGKEYVSNTHIVTRDRNRLIISNVVISEKEIVNEVLPLNGVISVSSGEITIEKKVFDGNIVKCKNVAMIDYKKIREPLVLRNIINGDRFSPLGMRGSKLVNDYLTDNKVSLPDKRKQLVVVDGDGRIVWLVGKRISAPFAVDKGTENVVVLSWNKLF